jgi:hypothetical protein
MEPTTAKQFLIDKVIEQAKLENVPFSEIEQKMLYFTEAYPSLPDIYEVNEEFERSHNADEYETKVALLLKSARSRDQSQSPQQEQQWEDALSTLAHQDHYILVMTNQAFGVMRSTGDRSRFRGFLVYIGVGVGLVILILWFIAMRAGH